MDMDTSDNDQQDQQQYSSFPDFQHLNIDLCLELICPYLDLDDLSSVADTCMQMKSAAELTFAYKYRKQFFYIHKKEESSTQYGADEDGIHLYRPKICFRILRCFGQMISKLCIQCSESPTEFWRHLGVYIEKYSANYLTELELRNQVVFTHVFTFEHLEITFPNVEKVRFIGCKMDGRITEFNKRFPKMRHLEFGVKPYHATEVVDQRCIMDYFPHLEGLSIDISHPGTYNSSKYGFKEETVLKTLELNPNLRSLHLFSGSDHLTEKFVQAISNLCESLDTLQFSGYPLEFRKTVHFKNVKYFKFNHIFSSLSEPIPLTFDALETFDCHAYNALPIALDFIRMNPSIAKVNLTFVSKCITHDRIIEMASALVLVEEIEIDILKSDEEFSEKEIPFFLNSLKSLQKLIVRPTFTHVGGGINTYNFDDLLKLTKSLPWTIDKKNEIIILKSNKNK